jgi:N-methylhydantoinase A/oxoprolinase/acetone carboxylase beta subunit
MLETMNLTKVHAIFLSQTFNSILGGLMRIGIDVGGTNTDAVLMDGRKVIGWAKSPTTRDVSSGITNVLNALLAQTQVAPSAITAVMLGTTHFTNAVVERKSLSKTAVIRIGLPATAALPPYVDWPDDLRDAMGGIYYLVHGGYEFDGRPISALRPDEIKEAAQKIRDAGIQSVAISSVFSPVNPDQEKQAAEIVLAEIPDASLSLSHEIGRIGLLERENAAAMNACLSVLAVRIVRSFRDALGGLGISAPFYISQNDGTLMSADFVEKYPVLTFASGPTNSMRGAAFLSGLKEAVVVDIGGTTSDVGVLNQGFPREASVAVRIGGVRTNFRMPDVLSFGLGGGSYVKQEPLQIGPQSVGYEITTRALVFGGSDLTTTDIAVAAGMADIGDKSKVAHLGKSLVDSSLQRMWEMIEISVDRMKTAAGAVPVILVGGGIILVGDQLNGVSELHRPEHASVANAIGAAIAQVGGEVDRIFSLDAVPRDKALERAKEEAQQRVLNSGAVPGTIEIVDVEEVPLAYLPGNATRIRVKAVGTLAVE